MEVQNILAKSIETAEAEKAALDASCKRLLANKIILAWILKTCVEEYKDCGIQEIEENYIEGKPQIAEIAVHKDEIVPENHELIEGRQNEDNSILEGMITYDIRFDAVTPVDRELISMIVNVEAQNDFYPGYPIIKRGIYYGSRMISSQYGTVFTNSHYEKMKKVYSIWVCINPPKYRENSINVYSFHEKQLIGSVNEKREFYDLIAIAMICLGSEEDKNCEGLVKLLTVLFSTEKDASEKKRILHDEFNIAMTKTMESEVYDMCNYSKGVEEKGIQKGIQKGIVTGVLTSVKNLIKNTGMTPEQAMAVLEIPENERQEYAAKLKQ